MCVINWNLTYVLREAATELAARIDISEKNVGNGIGGLSASEPYVEYCRNLCCLFLDGHRAAVEKEKHYRLACCKKCVQEPFLHVRNGDVAAAGAFA